MNNNIYILFLCIVFFVFFITFTTIGVIKNREYKSKQAINLHAWKYISIIIILAITSFYGVKIYQSATNFSGKLAWYMNDLKNERSVKFEHNNLYKYGVEGIFKDINTKHTLPKKLYITDIFDLRFDPDGTITSFYTYVYGENANGKAESYSINYDKKKAAEINVRLNGYVKADYNEDKLLEPLIQTVKAIPVQKTVSRWNESTYGLVYYGKRSWGYNTEGIINVSEDGQEQQLQEASKEIIGYTVSIFIPEKEKEITPTRYHLQCDANWCKSDIPPEKERLEKAQQELTNKNTQFYLSKQVGYKLNITDKALGSTLYSLSKTMDGGKTWNVINEDPFNGIIGSASGITFINDTLGFLGSSSVSGTTGELYRTDDGGISFKKINYPPHEVKLNNGQPINPFDFPAMPYEKDGVLNMLVGQGSDGDYNGDSSALYQSNDKGETWEYVKEVPPTTSKR